MTTTDINKIAAEARTLLEGISRANAKHDTLVADRNARVKPLLEKVHHTLTVLKQPVEGVTSWNAWAQKAGWSKRNLNFILNGRPSQKKKESTGNSSSRSSFLKRIAEAKKKLTDIQSQIDAYYNAPDGAEPDTDVSDLTAQNSPLIEPLFEEFLKLITPDGCEIIHGNHNWHVQAYGQPVGKTTDEEPLLHKPASVDSNFSRCGLPLDGLNYTFNRPTCPECRKRKKKKAVSPQFNKRELRAYSTLKALLDATVKGFENGTISADEWRATVKELDGKNTGRSVFRARHGRYVHFMDEVRERTEAAIRDAKTQEQHTGQHEDCPECWDYQQKQEQLEAKRTAAWQAWSKRIQTLINTWRNGRLRSESDYRQKFEEASEKYLARLKREGIERFDGTDGKLIVNEARQRMEGAIADRSRAKYVVTVSPTAVEGAPGTKLRTEAANAAYGEKKVSKKVYERILSGVSKYLKHLWTLEPPVPKRPENATVVCEHEGEPGRGTGMIISRSSEYEAWEAARIAAQSTPEYAAWNKERSVICELESALVQRYDPLMEGDLDGDDDPTGSYQED